MFSVANCLKFNEFVSRSPLTHRTVLFLPTIMAGVRTSPSALKAMPGPFKITGSFSTKVPRTSKSQPTICPRGSPLSSNLFPPGITIFPWPSVCNISTTSLGTETWKVDDSRMCNESNCETDVLSGKTTDFAPCPLIMRLPTLLPPSFTKIVPDVPR